MRRLAASGFTTALALVALGGAGMATMRADNASAQMAPQPATEFVLNRLELGQCRIHYEALPEDKQPAAMECEHAEWVAQRWGGQVLERSAEGVVERASFEGRNDFTGVPANALPRPGYCRAWIDGVDASVQPEESDCRLARTLANARGGRVIFMPI